MTSPSPDPLAAVLGILVAVLAATASRRLCGPCAGNRHRACEGAIGPIVGKRLPCRCQRCDGFGLPAPDQHGGDAHTCAPLCYGWKR